MINSKRTNVVDKVLKYKPHENIASVFLMWIILQIEWIGTLKKTEEG